MRSEDKADVTIIGMLLAAGLFVITLAWFLVW
jgi:hypothetical protein